MKYAVACPICDSQEVVDVDSFLGHCNNCDHYFQQDMKITCKYDAQYAGKYSKYDCSGMSYARAALILGILDLPKNAKILDIGYGNGSFLKVMEKLGYEIYGIDVHGQDFGITEIDYSNKKKFDLICFFDSLEHFDNLELPMKLKTKYIAVSMPHLPPLFPKNAVLWRHFRPGEHLHYFTEKSLDRYFAKWRGNRIAQGYPEDVVRGRINIEGQMLPNIYTAVYEVSKID